MKVSLSIGEIFVTWCLNVSEKINHPIGADLASMLEGGDGNIEIFGSVCPREIKFYKTNPPCYLSMGQNSGRHEVPEYLIISQEFSCLEEVEKVEAPSPNAHTIPNGSLLWIS